jgi:hypothetical protein
MLDNAARMLAGLLILAGAGHALADEDAGAHGKATRRTVAILGTDLVLPTNLDLGRGEVVQFENHAQFPITVTFTEPKEQKDKIRCQVVGARSAGEPKAPWLLFAWDADQHLAASIPPGRFANVCSLAPGKYAYAVDRLGGPQSAGEPGSHTGTGHHGTIVVQ